MPLDPHEAGAATLLASLPYLTHRRLRRLVAHGRPSDVLSALVSGDPPPADAGGGSSWWTLLAERPRGMDVPLGVLWREAAGGPRPRVDAGIGVLVHGSVDYPSALADDPEAPGVLFVIGESRVLDAPRVGIIGTRNSTAFGRATATEFGRELAEAGVAVVSGLARGIDAAAHRGALESAASRRGRPVAVVASGPDVVYPRENTDLWRRVTEEGLLVSESPPGTRPDAFRFPLRNRITAALCDVLLVVESRLDGGSMITVREALHRGVTVMAVPGSTATRAAEGTNLLIRDGALVALEPADVLIALGLDTVRRTRRGDTRRVPDDVDIGLLGIMGNEPLPLGVVAERAHDRFGLGLPEVALGLGRLEATGWVVCTSGWFERVDPFPFDRASR